MKEMYDWVAWHRELAKKIEGGGRDDLVEKIGRVAHKQALGPARLGRDPLSFFGFLRNSQSKSNEVCETVQDVFGLPELPDPKFRDIIFPSLSKSLSSEGAMFPVGNDDLLWRLFEQATQATEDNPDIKQEDWKVAMDMDGVEVGTLTQALFLVNPACFLPVDSAVDAYFPEGWRKEKEEKIKGDGGYAEYLSAQKEIKKLFRECEFYEIYTFLRWQEDKRAVNEDSNFFHISTKAHGEKFGDFWDKEGLEETGGWDKEDAEAYNFKENNWVFVGGPGGGIGMGWGIVEKESLSWEDIKNAIKEEKPGSSPYPLCDDPQRRDKVFPKRGDIILVRTGRAKGKAIGVVLENGYNKPDGLKAKSKIHVLWINKSDNPLAGFTEIEGFNSTNQDSKTYERFANAEAYKSSLELINQLRGKTIESGKQVNQEDRQQAEANTMKHPHPLNTILYGPPGTGKTYHTSHYAVAIIEGKSVEDVKNENHEKVKERFDKYRDENQIEMVTFHQNYAYEDFIEGIRPVLDEEGEEDVRYELRKGVFREISDRATKNREKSVRVVKNIEKDEPISETWDLDELLQAFANFVLDEMEIEGEFKLFSEDNRSRATIKKVSLKKGGMFSFQLGGSVTSNQYLSKKWMERLYKGFYEGEIKSAKDIYQKSSGLSAGHARYYILLFKRIQEFQAGWKPEPRPSEDEEGIKNYVLIIDEINRGNIAKIFGELITLIEESRRLGNKEETKVALPYSGDDEEPFSVPNNLYIIGTMNTADRSIALLDTALRRRFEFEEMMPDPALLPDASTNIDGVNCRDLLEKMNERIRVLLDREHQIGHTYFLGLKDMDALKKAFQNKIIPLLQEYFYDNWENIDLVLNQNGFINAKDIDSGLFKKSELIDEQRKIYEILPEDDAKWIKPESYINIYNGKQQGTESITE